MSAAPDGVLLPSANHADHVTQSACAFACQREDCHGATRILALITETAEGVSMPGRARPSDRLSGLT